MLVVRSIQFRKHELIGSQVVVGHDRIDRADVVASTAVDAAVGIDVQHLGCGV
jgi:hypothetical protein